MTKVAYTTAKKFLTTLRQHKEIVIAVSISLFFIIATLSYIILKEKDVLERNMEISETVDQTQQYFTEKFAMEEQEYESMSVEEQKTYDALYLGIVEEDDKDFQNHHKQEYLTTTAVINKHLNQVEEHNTAVRTLGGIVSLEDYESRYVGGGDSELQKQLQENLSDLR